MKPDWLDILASDARWLFMYGNVPATTTERECAMAQYMESGDMGRWRRAARYLWQEGYNR